MTTARADRREPRLEHHPTIPKAPPVDLAPHPPPSWSSSRWGLIPWVVLGAQCPQREETRYWTPAVRRIRTTERIRTNEADAYAWGILRSSAVVAGVSRWRRRSPGAQSPTCASVRGHRRRKRFRTIVPTMETRSMSPTGTNTVTLSDLHESVPGTRSTPSLARPSAPSPRIARTTAVTSRILPAVSTRRGYRHDPPWNRQVSIFVPSPRGVLGSWGLAARRPVANAHDSSLAHARARDGSFRAVVQHV